MIVVVLNNLQNNLVCFTTLVQDMTDSLLPSVLPFVYNGLQDVDDDVRAVAASAFVPVANNVVKVLPHQVVFSVT